jgi:hypothetical protein
LAKDEFPTRWPEALRPDRGAGFAERGANGPNGRGLIAGICPRQDVNPSREFLPNITTIRYKYATIKRNG